jgi:hypothetical protein
MQLCIFEHPHPSRAKTELSQNTHNGVCRISPKAVADLFFTSIGNFLIGCKEFFKIILISFSF